MHHKTNHIHGFTFLYVSDNMHNVLKDYDVENEFTNFSPL